MIGTYYTEDLLQEWFIKNLQNAKDLLGKFKSLHKLLDGFKGYENKRYRTVRNAIMFWCLPAIGDGLQQSNIERLIELEKAIDLFGVMKWPKSKLNVLKSRLASEDYIQSLSAATELQTGLKMAEKFGDEKVVLFPRLSRGGYSDISVNVDGRVIYFEIGNLGQSTPETKIKQILQTSATHLGQKVNLTCYICLFVDTAELVFDAKNRIDVDASVKKLNGEIDNLHIHELAGFEGFFNFRDISYIVADKKLYEKMKQGMPSYDQRLFDLVNNPIITKWLSSFENTLLGKVELIKGVMAGQGGRTRLIEIHAEGIFPSVSAKAELKSFINHITRNVSAQIEEQQLQQNAPNIVVVRGNNWLMTFLDGDELRELYGRLQEFYEQKKLVDLSGIAFYGDDLGKAVYLDNEYAKETSRLNADKICKLGFRWLNFEKAKQ